MSKKLRTVENNIRYIREQIERFMKYEYGIEYKIDVYGNKRIYKEGYFSRLEFKKGKPVAIDIAYELLVKGNKDKILKAGIREAIKVVLWYKRIPYSEASGEYIRELVKYKLPVYGNERQVGKYMHTYGCSRCKKIYVLRDRKLPPTKDISQLNLRSKCCGEKFEYFGKDYYDGESLYKIARKLGKYN